MKIKREIQKTMKGNQSRTTDKTTKIAFIGSRGIPAKYGASEVFTEEISKKMAELGFEVYVTCESSRFYQDVYNGMIRLHIPSIEGKTITVPSINDVIATIYLLLKCPSIELLYYQNPDATLGALIAKLFRKTMIINPGGIEWQRPAIRRKYFSAGWKIISPFVTWYLKLMEWTAIKMFDVVVADSRAIKTHLEQRYKAKNVVYITHGARKLINSDLPPEKELEIMGRLGLASAEYYLTVGRIVAENNIHRELEGFRRAQSRKKLAIVGNFNPKDGYTKYLIKIKNNDPNILFLDPIYDKDRLGILRKNCFCYIHAYQTGGTNLSLLEQMLFGRPIIANDVAYHRQILQDGGIYFSDEYGLARAINMLEQGKFDLAAIAEWQARRVKEEYNWDAVSKEYFALFNRLAGLEIDSTSNKALTNIKETL